MRKWLLKQEGFQKVKLEQSEIQKSYKLAGREYKIQYIRIPDKQAAKKVEEEIRINNKSFETFYRELWGEDSIPERTISWQSKANPIIHNALFSDYLNTGRIIGPLKIDEDNYILLKILGWSDNLALTEKSRQQRLNDVKKRLGDKKAYDNYSVFVNKIMKGKKLEFNSNTFYKMVNLIKPFYEKTPKEKQEMFLKNISNGDDQNPEFNEFKTEFERLLDEPFFKVQGIQWSVKDFMNELQKYPMLFPKNIKSKNSFAEKFKMTIVKMIEDKYVTQEAYKRGYQNTSFVKQRTQLWKDAILARHQKNKYLKNKIYTISDSIRADTLFNKYLNPYINELQEKYSDQVSVNVEKFNNLTLSKIDMIVTQRNVPFKKVVPDFPILTTDYKLDYGKRME